MVIKQALISKMQAVLIPTFTKTKSAKHDNHWVQSNPQQNGDGFERSHSSDKERMHMYILAYLELQKKLIEMVRKCRKQEMKLKRQALRTILEHSHQNMRQKSRNNSLLNSGTAKKMKSTEKRSSEPENLQLKEREIGIICVKQGQINCEKLMHLVEKLRVKLMFIGWTNLKTFGLSYGAEIQNYPHKNSLPVNEKKKEENEQAAKNQSRLSNKRKNTKGREDHKENSHLSAAEISIQNQRLRHELMQDEEERESFMEQLGDLLDHHQKYLAQGSSTNRTKKNK